MNRKTAVRVTALLAAVLIALTFAASSFAEGGNGDGTGGGKDKPLVLDSSSVPNGSENVSPDAEIVLTFTKNVVHFTVRENNMKCFSMTDSKGNNVPIDVIMGDDQVDPSIKRIVTIKPKSPLTPGETYLLKIGGGVTSKSGVSIGKDTYISFTVANTAATTTAKPTTKPATTVKPSTTKRASSGGGYVGSPATTKPSTTTTASTSADTSTAKTVPPKTTVSVEKAKREITHRAVSTTKATPEADGKATVRTTAPEKTDNEVLTVTVTETTTQTGTSVLQTGLWLWDETEKNESAETYSESVTQQAQPGNISGAEENNGGVRKALPYIITGIIAVIAVPAIALTIKKKKDNNT
ncbi:MAG: Ig-like domain-containing protein [Clostridia bacterium]|nr:Ig-like domain-containing protein [Clostridia bacterium]